MDAQQRVRKTNDPLTMRMRIGGDLRTGTRTASDPLTRRIGGVPLTRQHLK
jgi:hypothetical protein